MSTDRWPALTEALLARKRSAKILAAVILVMALGLTGALYAISDGDGSDRRVVKAFLQGGIMIVGGLIYMAWAFLHKPEKHKLLLRMIEQPENIVWIYKESQNGVMHVVAAFVDKKRFRIAIEDKNDLLSRVWAELASVAPGAEVGWSEGRNNLYLKDPRVFLNRSS
jgi:hypothetical protein